MVIAIEIIVAVGMFVLGLYFWNCIKARKFLSQLLANESELKEIITSLGKDAIIREAEHIQPPVDSGGEKIEVTLHSGIKAIDRLSNILLVAVVGLVVASYFLGSNYLIINDCIAFAAYFFPIRSSTKNRVIADVQNATVDIYKWKTVDSKKCKKYCIEHSELKNIYRIVNKL